MMRPARSTRTLAILVTLALLTLTAAAQYAPHAEGPNLDDAKRQAIIESIAVDLEETYIFADVAAKMIEHLGEQQRSGAYSGLDDLSSFSVKLTDDMQAISHDLHLHVRQMAPGEADGAGQVDHEVIHRRWLEGARRANYGFQKVERLAGNVGYLDLRQFADAAIGGATAIASMNLLAGSDALIIDLRQNGGGSPSMIQLISSYFFDEPVHLNSFYIRRGDETTQFWTHSHVEGPRMSSIPLFVLTSGRTFSAAEEFTYNLRNLERATIVGETTGGGAHPVDMVHYPEHGLRMSLPFGRAINPITGTNWEGTGVEPHIKVPAADAFSVAYAKALETIEAEAKDPDHQRELAWTREGVEAAKRKIALTADEMAAYAGTYGPRRIHFEDGKLLYQRGQGPVYELAPMGEDEFRLPDIARFRIRFERDGNGRVTTLVGHYSDGRENKSPRDDG